MSFSHYSTCGDYHDKDELVYKLKYMRCDGTIKLDKRIRRYLRSKKHNKKHNIKPCISPEEEYNITTQDRRLVRAYLRSKKSCGDKSCGERICCEPKLYFPSKAFRDGDPRVPKPRKTKYELPLNMGMFVPEKDASYFEGPIFQSNLHDARDFASMNDEKNITGFDINDVRFDPRTDPVMHRDQYMRKLPVSIPLNKYHKNSCIPIEFGAHKIIPRHPYIEKHDKNKSQYRVPHDDDPRNKYMISDISNNDAGYNKNHISVCGYKNDNIDLLKDHKLIGGCLSNVLNNEKRYGSAPKQSFSEKSVMDTKNKVVIPKMNNKFDRNFDTSSYTLKPPINTHGNFIDSDMETSLIRGMPQHTTKSYGYRNPEEHYFEFLPEDFVNERTTEPWIRGGVSTRLDNTRAARPVTRRIY
uniref:Uncharacterized protein n=1 Tax=Mimivirus LCMiAC01 TaxID=2506608 RepID=A0A481YZW0_9VIRU|nr:MAG: hypothetical protein LCMiAC01_00390 [Mimivirus LCMiAC01]